MILSRYSILKNGGLTIYVFVRRIVVFRWFKKLYNKIKIELAYRKRLKELVKKDPYIYK